MTDMLLDTTLFQDYRDGHPGARAVVERIVAGEVTASFSPFTVFELWSSPGFDRRTEIGYLGLLRFLEEAPLSAEAAKVAGIWLGSISPEERAGMEHTTLAAAIARERGEPVCTRNAEQYSRFFPEIVDY